MNAQLVFGLIFSVIIMVSIVCLWANDNKSESVSSILGILGITSSVGAFALFFMIYVSHTFINIEKDGEVFMVGIPTKIYNEKYHSIKAEKETEMETEMKEFAKEVFTQ